MYIAIKDETTGYSEPLLDHLNRVGDLSSNFAKSFNLSDQAYVLGYLHDLGKYSKEFQKQINNSNITLDYSIAGALELFHRFYSDKDLFSIAKLLGMVLTGHHNGLLNLGVGQDLDNGTHESKFKKHLKDYYNGFYEIDENAIKIYKEDLDEKIQKSLKSKQDDKKIGFIWQMIIRMLFSCTLDGDFIDIEIFFKKYDHYSFKSINYLASEVDKFMSNDIYESKKKIKEYLETSSNRPGLFTLTAPPNLQGTIGTFIFGVKHAVKNGLKRIIYVVPYNSPIDRYAKLFKEIASSENVIEHFCDFAKKTKNNDTTENILRRYNYFTEDWNAPVIVTNNREFFETCFSSDIEKLRKFHNISDSVIIFDEIQALPMDYMDPCFTFLNEIIVNYNSSVVLSSCASIYVNEFFDDEILKNKMDIIKNYHENYDLSSKAHITYLGSLYDDEIIKRLNSHDNALCVVNTRFYAKELYEKLKGKGVYYLSSLLTPYDRKSKIELIKNSLKNNDKCIVIVTEDVDNYFDFNFDYVYKSISSVDLMFKSYVNCTREFFVFKLVSDSYFKKDSKDLVKYCEDTMKKSGDEFFTLNIIDEYYRLKYSINNKKNKFDKKSIRDNFLIKRNQLKFNFKTCSDDFKFLDSNTYNIIIQNQFTKGIIDNIRDGNISKENFRNLEDHCVTIYEYEFLSLKEDNAFDFCDRFIILNDLKLYDDSFGLNIFNGSSYENYII
ncbi:MAG: CRISPR-associated endonuclease Cas3'' [Oscillospiraceae bacterium]|nr:CRISPR-associated endonuclease Cas3'' [Oscillospiraceae bacterium]